MTPTTNTTFTTTTTTSTLLLLIHGLLLQHYDNDYSSQLTCKSFIQSNNSPTIIALITATSTTITIPMHLKFTYSNYTDVHLYARTVYPS